MLIVCPTCVSSYKIEPGLLARAGAPPRCAHCRQPLPTPATSAPFVGEPTMPPMREERSALAGVLAAVAVLGVISGALFWRDSIARAVPGAEGVYRMAGIRAAAPVPTVSDVKTTLAEDGLRIEATLANPHGSRLVVPRLRITIRDDKAAALYSWTAPAPKTSLEPGETIAFASRLDKPPAGGHDLAVSFAADRVAASDETVKNTR